MQTGSNIIPRSEIITSLRLNPLKIFTSGFIPKKRKFWKTRRAPKKTVLVEIFIKNLQKLIQDLKFSREGDYLRISSRRGDTLRPVFILPGLKCEEPSLKFRADNLMQQNVQEDNLIANLEK
jgi:hypothetical protein